MKGFVYMLTSASYLPYLAKSLRSLRRFHAEPVTVFALPELRADVEALGCASEEIQLGKKTRGGKLRHYHAKVEAAIRSPYQDSVAVECDILVRASIDHFFGHPLTLVQIGKRLTEWGKPLTNPGVMGFGSDRTFLEMVLHYARKGGCNDQRVMNRKQPDDARILDDSWMVCPERFGAVPDPKTVHFVRRCFEKPTRWTAEWEAA